MLMFADCLEINDINTLVRTSWALKRLLAPYMYRRAKDGYSRGGRPFFLRAVDTGSLTAVEQFIEVGTSVNISDPTNHSLPTALHSCVTRGNIRMAALLIRNGVNMSVLNGLGSTPLHCAVSGPNSSEALVELLLDAGADISATSEWGQTILFTATMYGPTSIVQLLLHRGAVPTVREGDGATLLHWAAKYAAATTVSLILEGGANIEVTNDMGETPLHNAALAGRTDNVETLLQWGANVEATSLVGFTPLLHSVRYWPRASTRTLAAAHRILHRAPRPDGGCWQGTEACVPSCQWAEHNHPIVDLLLDAGVDILRTTDSNCSLLDWAAAYVNPQNN
jgi:ankyrin repeat protein